MTVTVMMMMNPHMVEMCLALPCLRDVLVDLLHHLLIKMMMMMMMVVMMMLMMVVMVMMMIMKTARLTS